MAPALALKHRYRVRLRLPPGACPLVHSPGRLFSSAGWPVAPRGWVPSSRCSPANGRPQVHCARRNPLRTAGLSPSHAGHSGCPPSFVDAMGWLHRLCLSLPASAGSSYSSYSAYLLTCHHPPASPFLLVAKNHGSCTPLTSILDPTLSICPSCPSVAFIGNARNPPLRDAPAAIRGIERVGVCTPPQLASSCSCCRLLICRSRQSMTLLGTVVINPILYAASRRQSSLIAHSICNALVNRVLFWYCCHIRDVHISRLCQVPRYTAYPGLARPHGSVAP